MLTQLKAQVSSLTKGVGCCQFTKSMLHILPTFAAHTNSTVRADIFVSQAKNNSQFTITNIVMEGKF
jgi:hypothetical protein